MKIACRWSWVTCLQFRHFCISAAFTLCGSLSFPLHIVRSYPLAVFSLPHFFPPPIIYYILTINLFWNSNLHNNSSLARTDSFPICWNPHRWNPPMDDPHPSSPPIEGHRFGSLFCDSSIHHPLPPHSSTQSFRSWSSSIAILRSSTKRTQIRSNRWY